MNFSTFNFKSYVATLLALVALTCLAGLAATEWLVRARVEPTDQVPVHLQLFHAAQERNASFGDSHAACGFYPPAGMVNLAFPGENNDNMKYKARIYFGKRSPQHVIVQADAHMFARYRSAATRGYNESFDQAPNEQSAFSVRTLSSYHRPKLFAYWKVWLLKGGFESRTKLSSNGWIECTDRWLSVAPETRKTLARERAILHEPAEDFLYSDSATAYERLLQELLHKGAQVCMVEFPVTPEYQQAVPQASYQASRAWFATQAQRFSLRYLAHAGAYADRPDLFSDMDHLNAPGAREFSQRIVRECFE